MAVLLATTMASGTPQGGFPFLAKRKSLPCPFTTNQNGTEDSLECSVTEWSRIEAGNVKRPTAQKMDGSKPVSMTMHGQTPTWVSTTAAKYDRMEFHQVFTGFILQIIERSDFSVDVASVRKKEISVAVSIKKMFQVFRLRVSLCLPFPT